MKQYSFLTILLALVALTAVLQGQTCKNVLVAWGDMSAGYTIFNAMMYRAGNLSESVPFDLQYGDNVFGGQNVTIFASSDSVMQELLATLKLSIHSYLTMDQTWLRTILYTHVLPDTDYDFEIGDVYPTLNPYQNVTVIPGRVEGEVGLKTDLTKGYFFPEKANTTVCQAQWFELDGFLLPPISARLQLTGGFPAEYQQLLKDFAQRHGGGTVSFAG